MLSVLKQKFLEVLPISLFLFVVFNLRNITDPLMYGRAAATPRSLLVLALLATAAGKVLLVTDLLPFVNAFRGKPLIYSTLWKTLIYSLAALLYRFLELLLRARSRFGDLDTAFQHLWAEENWHRFWGVQIWLVAIFLLFVASRELVIAIGGGRVLARMFFGRGTARG